MALGVVLTGVAAGLIGFAGAASAHTRDVKAACEGDTTTLQLNLQSYATSKKKENHVKVTDGTETLVDEGFQSKFVKNYKTSGSVEHTFTVVVTAWDDNAKYGFTQTLHVKACVAAPPSSTSETTTTTTTTSSSTTETTSSTEAPPTETTSSTENVVAPPSVTPTTTTTTPEVKEEALASTGASIGLPLGIAGVLLAGGAAALFVVRRRSKA
ncbi:LPXTG cell wall anchor domain-containing protein [Actinophytocola oryzae]|uniref:LPXTG cell wall anchor domain-containing protein n=1 Tax=Actinophytocola oryzae TaxID=502181 RepID=UPI001063448E|nr:LPXTG cell wall anchor domain-containing protein [Actinophytocola oryzae]